MTARIEMKSSESEAPLIGDRVNAYITNIDKHMDLIFGV